MVTTKTHHQAHLPLALKLPADSISQPAYTHTCLPRVLSGAKQEADPKPDIAGVQDELSSFLPLLTSVAEATRCPS